jgi:mRNA-degrading endonuclease YafQ of YafQ-DinJ toxin-antitoxin module
LREEAAERIVELASIGNHSKLKVHKLHGKFKNCFSFSVNYRTRIVFQYENKRTISLLTIGDHEIYR